jgi:hypothetical protein
VGVETLFVVWGIGDDRKAVMTCLLLIGQNKIGRVAVGALTLKAISARGP